MAAPTIARQWFVPGEGIERAIISADVQRYLGNDATVRPGQNQNEEGEVIQGFWIKAYRNFTSAMIEDIKADSAKYKREQGKLVKEVHPGPTVHQPNTTRVRQGNDSPRNVDHGPVPRGDYRGPPPREAERYADRDMTSMMDIDAPSRPGFSGPDRNNYPVDVRGPFPPERGFAQEPPHSMGPGHSGRTPVAPMPPYGPPHADYHPNYPSHDVPPQGFQRQQGGYYGPSSGFDGGPAMPSRNEPIYPGSYNGPPGPPRGHPGYGPADYQDPRYAYPSPAVTVSSVSGRDREPLSGGPQQQSRFPPSTGPPQSYHYADHDERFGQVPPALHDQYDQYGRPISSGTSQPSPTMVDPPLARGPSALRRPASIQDTREATRRRI